MLIRKKTGDVTYSGQGELRFCIEGFAHHWFPVSLIHICQGLKKDKRNRKLKIKIKYEAALDQLCVKAL